MMLILFFLITSNDTLISRIITDLGYENEIIRSADNFYKTLDLGSLEISNVKEKIKSIATKIKKEVRVQNLPCYADGTFELNEVFQYREGNCLGMTQLFYVFGKYEGFKIHAIIGRNHIANLVVIDSLSYLVDLAADPDPYVSNPFIFTNIFCPITGNYYRLKNKQFFPSDEMRIIYDKVHLVDDNGIIAAVYYNRGLRSANREEFSKAIDYFDVAIRFNPSFAEAHANKGKVLLLLNRISEAKSVLDQSIKLYPFNSSAFVDRASVNLLIGAISEAITDCHTAIKLNPENLEAFITRGNGYTKLGQYQRAIIDYDTALKLDPSSIESFINRGIAYAEMNNHPRAINDFNQAIALNPDLYEGYHNRANSYYKLKKYKNAIADYSKSVEFNPKSWPDFFNRGNCYFQLNHYQSAMADFNKAIYLNPTLTEAYLNRGVIYYNLREITKAKQDFETVFLLDKNIFQTFYGDIKKHGKSHLLLMLNEIISGKKGNNARNGSQP